MADLTSESNPRGSIEIIAGRVVAGSLTVLAATAYSAFSLYRHRHFASNALDLAIQDQTVWGYSRFEFIHNTVLGIPNLLGDHFHPILVLLAPFMWVWNSAGVLLVAQGVLLALAGIPIYLWAEHELGPVAGVAFVVAYLSFWGVLAGVVYDFHHVVFAVPAISLSLYGTLARRNWLLLPGLAGAMLTREDVALTLIALGVFIAVVQRRWIFGAVIAAANALWFALLLGVVMPALGGSAYRHWTYDALGTGPLSALLYVLGHPLSSLELLFTPLIKVRVWLGSFASFVLLPLASPIILVAVPSFLERFWSASPNLWSFHYQYSMLPAPILTFAAIDTCARIRRLAGPRWDGIGGLAFPMVAAAASVVLSFVFIQPFAEAENYLPAARVAEIQSCLDVIPPDASVAASSRLVPHLSHRPAIYVVSSSSNAEYIAVDPSTYDGFYPGEEDQLRGVVNSALEGDYGVACARSTTLVLSRGATSKELTPELARWLAGECSGRVCAAQ